MKYAEQIKQYIERNGNIGDRHEEPKDDHPRDPLTGAQLRDIDPEFEETQETEVAVAAPTFVKPETEPKQKAPKKKRGRPVGSKNKTKKSTKKPVVTPVAKEKQKRRRTRTPHISETNLTVGMSQELFDDIEKAATHNFRTLANEVCWVLTQYYNGKL
tara:strand:- start:101 stop:574 length:474 start_codon:yes stop_codon:yes gene_type:complete